MKKVILPILILFAAVSTVKAQCDKKLIISSSKTEYLNASNEVQDTKPEHTSVEISKSEITVIPNDEPDNKMTGTSSTISCNWKVPFKEGKSVYKTSLTDKSGDIKNLIITIEAKEGKVSFIAEMDDNSGRKIRLIPEKFEEKAE